MATKDQDTDPSTPRARRPLSAPPAVRSADPASEAEAGHPCSPDELEGDPVPASDLFAPGDVVPSSDPAPSSDPVTATELHPSGDALPPSDPVAATELHPSSDALPSSDTAAELLPSSDAAPSSDGVPLGDLVLSSDAAPSSEEGIDVTEPPGDTTNQTDPGVGPPAPIRVLAPQTIGVVVPGPASSSPSSEPISAEDFTPGQLKKDSVELLLAGIASAQPDRTKTTPQTDGEASAAYHAEHSLRRASNPRIQTSTVLIDRPPTLRAIPLSAHQQRARDRASGAAEAPTHITGRRRSETPLPRRLFFALVAGALVVLAAFVAIRTVGQGADSQDTPSSEPPAPSPPSVVAAASPSAPGAMPSMAVPEPRAPAPPTTAVTPVVAATTGTSAATVPAVAAGAAVAAPPAVSAASGSEEAPSASEVASPARTVLPWRPPSFVHRRRTKVEVIPMPSATSGDLGEFKTSF
jgi:hypothetical protein